MASNLDRISELRALRERPFDALRQRAKDQEQEDYERLQRAIARREAAQQSFFKERAQENLLRQKGDIELTLAEQQQSAQMQRDKSLHLYGMQDMSHRANLEADASAQNYGYTMQRDKQEQNAHLQRDTMQHGYTMQRDKQQFGYQTQRDATQQGYTQQNAIQRETFNVSAKWQDQIQQARNAGMEFSEKQQNEMKQMDETFRKNVLNGPMDEGLKQQAMLEHQRKLSAIIPNEKIQDPKQGLDQSVIFHEPTKSWFMQGRDSHGYPTWQPLGGGGGKQEDPEKKAKEQQSMMLKREETLIKLDKEIRAEVDPETDAPKFKTQDDIDKEKLRRLAPYERYYTDPAIGLPPHEMYQIQAHKEKMKQIEQQQMKDNAGGMADSLAVRSGDPVAQSAYEADPPQAMPGQMPPAAAPPVPVSSKTIDDQLKQSVTGGDVETATALKAVKDLTAKHKGVPPYGTEDRAILEDAMRFLGAKGYKFGSTKKQPKKVDFQDALGGWQQ